MREFKRKSRVLLIDDNADHLRGIKELITLESSFDVVGATTSANIGINLAKKYRPDLILMDIQMPVMNGRDAAKQIRSMDRKDAGEIPIFALSADAFVEDQRLSAMSGMNGHFTKPIDFEEMRVQIG